MNIYQKIAEVMKEVRYLSKDDDVAFGTTKYKGLSEEKITAIMREAMLKQGLVVYPVEQECNRTGNITHIDVKYRMVNIEDPSDYIEIVSAGDGADTQDKGSGKAMTYAFKYMFLRTFAIPTGEDPDKIASAQLDAEEAERKKAEEEKARKEAEDLSKPIGKAKGATLKKICEGAGVNTEKLLSNYKVKAFEELNGAQYGKILQLVNEAKEGNGGA